MTRFSDEEKSIIGMYNTTDRVGLIVKIKEAIPYIEDADLKDTAAVEAQEHKRSVADLINLALNTECYSFIPDISDYDDYGRYKAEESGIKIGELGDLEDFVNFWDYGEQCKKDNKAVFLDSYGVLEKGCAEFIERYNGDLNTIPKEYSITTDALSEIEIEDSMGLAVRIDEYLRANHPDYDRVYSEIIEMQQDLSDNILLGKTHRIKQVFNEMGLTSADEPYKSLCEFEKNYPKRLFVIYQLKDDDSTRGLRFESLEQIKKR